MLLIMWRHRMIYTYSLIITFALTWKLKYKSNPNLSEKQQKTPKLKLENMKRIEQTILNN